MIIDEIEYTNADLFSDSYKNLDSGNNNNEIFCIQVMCKKMNRH